MDQPHVQATVSPHQPLPSFTALLQSAWKAYRANALVLSGLLALPVLLFILIDASTYGLIGAPDIWQNPSHDFSNSVFGGFTFSLLIALVTIFIGFWAQSSLLFAVTHREVSGNIQATLRGGWHLMGEVFLTGVISGLAVGLGFVLLIVPGVYLWIAFSFALIIVAAERHSGSDALKMSRDYVKGYWFDVLWKLLGFTVAWNIITFLLGFFVHGLTETVVTAILSLIQAPVYLLFTYHLYLALKAAKEHGATTA